MALDVVCKMEIDEKNAKYKSEYNDTSYYFCSSACKDEFDKNPEKFIQSPK